MNMKKEKLIDYEKINPAIVERIYSVAYEMIYEPELLILAELAIKLAAEKGTKNYTKIINYIKRFSND